MSPEAQDKRIARLEDREKHVDARFQNLHKKIDDNRTALEKDIKLISNAVEEVRKGQHSQELVNQKMSFTLDSINHERERQKEEKKEAEKEQKKYDEARRKDMFQIKLFVLGLGGTIATSLIVALVRMWLGI